MPYLTLPPSTRRRDRWLSHPELLLAPGWVVLGMIGIRDALSDVPPWHPVLTVLAVVTAGTVSVSGLLLMASVAKTSPLSTVWALERAGWITGVTGWATYLAGVGWNSEIVTVLAPLMVGIGLLRLTALSKTEAHVRGVKTERENGGTR